MESVSFTSYDRKRDEAGSSRSGREAEIEAEKSVGRGCVELAAAGDGAVAESATAEGAGFGCGGRSVAIVVGTHAFDVRVLDYGGNDGGRSRVSAGSGGRRRLWRGKRKGRGADPDGKDFVHRDRTGDRGRDHFSGGSADDSQFGIWRVSGCVGFDVPDGLPGRAGRGEPEGVPIGGAATRRCGSGEARSNEWSFLEAHHRAARGFDHTRPGGNGGGEWSGVSSTGALRKAKVERTNAANQPDVR